MLVTKASDREVFDQAFHDFWRNPNLLERAFGMTLPPLASGEAQPEALQRRVAEAMAGRMPDFSTDSRQDDELQEESSAGWSASEQLRQRDFEGMSAEELALAKQAIAKLAVRLKQVKSRRHQPCSSGNRVDLRRTLRRSLRGGGRFSALERTKVRLEPPPLVLICDISGSMSRYSRICLHFAHALSERFSRVYAFVFGTRLTHEPPSSTKMLMSLCLGLAMTHKTGTVGPVSVNVFATSTSLGLGVSCVTVRRLP